jgi:hypothetical protein
MRWLAWAIGAAVVVIMALVFCRRSCKQCKLREACDMSNVVGRDD